jgi:peptide/nickel transport system substrate-binding protein
VLRGGAVGAAGLAAFLDARGGNSPTEKPPGSTGAATGAAPGTATSGGVTAPGEQPVRGGILRRQTTQDPSSFDLHREISTSVVALAAPLHASLLTVNPHKEGEYVPDLATALPEQPDPTTYVFKLNPQAKFHDGTPVTAEDVVANYQWMIKPPPGEVSSRELILSIVDSVTAVDPATVRFKLKGPNASFIANNAVPYVAIAPKAILAKDGNLKTNTVGAGPFKFKEFQPGVSFSLERNPNYFKPNLPYLDGIQFLVIRDRNTALENFIGGKFDFYQPQPEQLADIQSRLGSKATVKITPSTQRNHLFMNTERRPFNDPRVREALSVGLDRSVAVQVVSGGQGIELGSYMHPQGVWALPEAEIATIPGYTKKADVTKARALLTAAGVTGGDVRVLYRSIFENTGVYMVDQLRQLGFNPRPVVLEGAAIYTAGDSGDFDVFIWTAAPALDDPDAVLGDIGVSSAPRNWSRITVPEADQAYARQTTTLDARERKALVNTADRALLSAFASIVIDYENLRFAFYPKLRNKDFLLGENYTNQKYEDVWLAQG